MPSSNRDVYMRANIEEWYEKQYARMDPKIVTVMNPEERSM